VQCPAIGLAPSVDHVSRDQPLEHVSPKQLAKRVSISPPAQLLRGALSTVTAR